MKLVIICIVVLIGLASCYKSLSLEGFDKEAWLASRNDCSSYRVDVADLIIDNQKVLMEATQNEVESLLGVAREHELYARNQKFFHYRLTPDDECGDFNQLQFLTVRFNAIGRASEVQITIRSPQ